MISLRWILYRIHFGCHFISGLQLIFHLHAFWNKVIHPLDAGCHGFGCVINTCLKSSHVLDAHCCDLCTLLVNNALDKQVLHTPCNARPNDCSMLSISWPATTACFSSSSSTSVLRTLGVASFSMSFAQWICKPRDAVLVTYLRVGASTKSRSRIFYQICVSIEDVCKWECYWPQKPI